MRIIIFSCYIPRYACARTSIVGNACVLDNGNAAVSLQNIVIRRLQAVGMDYRRAFLTLIQETMEACPAINAVAQVGITSCWSEPTWDYAHQCKLKRRIAFRIFKPLLTATDISCYGYSATGRYDWASAKNGGSLLLFIRRVNDSDSSSPVPLGRRRSGEVMVDTGEVSVDGRTVFFWSADVPPEQRNISFIGDKRLFDSERFAIERRRKVVRFLFDSEEDAERVAAAVRAAIRIWQDEGDSLRQSGRLPGYAGLEGMLEKPEAVRCVLDVGDDFHQNGDADFDMTLLNAIDVVKGEKYRTYHGIEDSKTLEFRLFAALPIEGNVPKDAVLAKERPKDAAAEQ